MSWGHLWHYPWLHGVVSGKAVAPEQLEYGWKFGKASYVCEELCCLAGTAKHIVVYHGFLI